MISNNNELFDLVESLRRVLHNAGFQQLSDALADATSISTVAGEVLGETRLELRKLRSTNSANFGHEASSGRSVIIFGRRTSR